MTDPTSTPRPRPEYGEYATPDEVAAARGPLPVEEVVAPPAADAPPRLSTPRPDSTSRPGAVSGAGRRPATATRGPARWDLPITVGLIAIAFINTISSIPSYLALDQALNEAGVASGMGDLTFGAAAQAGGIALLIVDTVLLLLTIGLAWRRYRAGKRAVWVPVIAFGIRLALYIVIIAVIVANTPGFLAIVENPPS